LRAGRRTVLALSLTTAVTLVTSASAHRRDEYLQAARLGVEPSRVELELDLTPGIALAEATIADIDRDRDGVLSADEKHQFLGRVFDGVVLELDGRPLHLDPASSTFPGLDAFRHGEGTIRVHSTVALPDQVDGDHRLAFRHMDQRDGSVYLANALVPRSDRILITAQRRDPAQRDLTIDYVLRPGSATSILTWLLGGLTGVAVMAALLMRPSKMAYTSTARP
jgi:hypothetical protein